MKLVLFTLLFPLMTPAAATYPAHKTAIDGIEVVQLADAERQMQVSVAPSVGNMAYEFLVKGKNVLWCPVHGPGALKERQPFSGVPFLAPWANRLDGDSYWANDKKFLLNPDLGNVRRDNHQKPIHGLLNFSSAWVLADSGADAHSAWVTSRLDFYRHPDLMAQFPFAHTLTMTYRLSNGELEVETTIDNLSDARLMHINFDHSQARATAIARALMKEGVPAKKVLVDAAPQTASVAKAEIFVQG